MIKNPVYFNILSKVVFRQILAVEDYIDITAPVYCSYNSKQ